MTREEKVKFIIDAIETIEGFRIYEENLNTWSDEKLDEEVEWFDYLLDK